MGGDETENLRSHARISSNVAPVRNVGSTPCVDGKSTCADPDQPRRPPGVEAEFPHGVYGFREFDDIVGSGSELHGSGSTGNGKHQSRWHCIQDNISPGRSSGPCPVARVNGSRAACFVP